MKLYKILDTATGLYSSGGVDPKWTKVGKTWSVRSQVINSLNVYCDGTYRSGKRVPPDSWVVQEYEVSKPRIFSAKELVGEFRPTGPKGRSRT